MSVDSARLTRLRRPSWRDPRLLLGIALILLAVIGGSLAMSWASQTTKMYAAAGTLVPGSVLRAADLRIVDVRLGTESDRYLSAAQALPAETVLLRQVGRGELVPKASLGGSSQLTARPVLVSLDDAAPADLKVGVLVDVWVTPKANAATVAGAKKGEATASSKKVVAGATVTSVSSGGSLAISGAAVQVLVDEATLPVVLQALAGEDRIDLVVVPGSSSS